MSPNAFDDPWALLSKRLTAAGSDVAVHVDGRDYRYEELARATDSLSVALAPLAPAQASVGVLLGMLPEYLVADLSILQSNLVKVPLNPMLSGAEMIYILRHSQAPVLLTSSRLPVALTDKVAEIRHEVPDLVVVEVSLDELLAAGTAPGRRAPASPTDRAAIYYTGGTSGRPKGVVHSRTGVATTILAHVMEAEIGSGDVLLLSTSLSHSAGAFAAASLARGARMVLLDKFTPESFCRTAKSHGATWAMVVPTMLYRLLDHLENAPDDVPALSTFVYGSAPITPSRLRQAIEVFGPIFIQLFGQTECPNWGTALGKRDHAKALLDESILATCGKPCILASAAVVDEQDRPLGAGRSGEIVLSAPYAMAEYWQNPEATGETLVDGWVHTRDIGEWDRQGYLLVKDRKSDMIISGGYNIYSSEVEAELGGLPGVADVAVIGIPDPDWGESVCAIIVREPGADLDEAAVLAASRELLGNYKRPKSVIFAPEIPLTALGKADKKKLREPFWSGQSRAV